MVRSPHCNLGQRPRYANDERVGVCHRPSMLGLFKALGNELNQLIKVIQPEYCTRIWDQLC
ncbi:MAG: hypothetical protein F6K53_43260 [Moorea sp. SIO4A1]|uniref:hypothetical protein n=1 Tax=Moorena sp. SIO4A1 TaxID=2607835 RepID=UPI0014185377|nr:hypothetical protein [Moorena sp. SIO4A1]NEO42837.1 hypothetical protein [Moorena sp. SIO4A3]NEQ63757.1 hypothetical protein [Moorena sp. SIO4A1]